MGDLGAEKPFDLEERTELFAKQVRAFLRTIPRTIANQEDGRRLIKSAGSVGANYIEAQEALSKKDFRMRIRISRKETKESGFWLRLLELEGKQNLLAQRDRLVAETNELIRIFTAILKKIE